MALSQFLLLLVLVPQAWGDFLSGIKLGGPGKIKTSLLPKVQLPPVISSGARAVEKVVKSNPGELAEGLMETVNSTSFHKDLKAKAQQGLVEAQQEASVALEKAAGTVSNAKPQDVQSALGDAAGAEAVDAAKSAARLFKALPTARPEGIASALREGSSWVSQSVNQTSFQAAEFVQTLGPRGAAFLDNAGHQLANKLSGPDRVLPFDILPPDVPERSLAALVGAVLLLILTVCGAFLGYLVRKAAGRKGPARLSEALMPLAESSARSPALQMATTQDALLREC